MVDIKKIQKKKYASKSSINTVLTKEISLSKYKLKDNIRERFYGEISMLLSSGVDIRTALSIIIGQQRKAKDKKIFEEILELVISGVSLSDSMQTVSQFSKYEEFSVRIGEETGKLTGVLKELASYYAEKIKQHKKLISALSYPGMVMITAILVIIFMMNFIVPMFQNIFSRFGQELPMLTRWVLDASTSFNEHYWKFGLLIIVMLIVNFFIKDKTFYRKHLSALVLKISLIGNIVRTIYLRQFCGAMHLLLSSGVPLLRALDLSKQMIRYYPLECSLEKTSNDILDGSLLYKSLSENKLFDVRIIALIKLGEEVNKLPEIFLQLKNQYGEELRHKTGLLNSVLEPILIIIIGGMVAVILVAMYLPMFSVGGL